ncbi:MAG: FAD-dependent oxidoreductase [Kofleriaceae bacterium]
MSDQAFPVLEDSEIKLVESCSHERALHAGEILYDQGERSTKWFVILEGEIEVVSPRAKREEPFAVLSHGQFTGEMNLLAGANSLARVRAKTTARVLEVDRSTMRQLVSRSSQLGDKVMRAFILRHTNLMSMGGGVVLVGSRHSSDTLRVQQFLTRNSQPHETIDVESDPAAQPLLDQFGISIDDVPVVICLGWRVLKNPTNQELAECLGMVPKLDEAHVRDVVVVGAGPAGLAAAIYGGSEGLDVLVIESLAAGGQAGSSSKIENYLGFPTGISGQELAERAWSQAEKFGTEIAISQVATKLDCDKRPYRVVLGHRSVLARSVVIATGARYHKPEKIPNLAKFEGNGIYYSATAVEARMCGAEDVCIVGGANSAGQAAVFLSRTAKKVHILVRGRGLSDTMSRYLIARIEDTPNIELLVETEIVELHGERDLQQVTWLRKETGERVTKPIQHVFMMTGASPNTEWLDGCVCIDDKGFIKAGTDLSREDLQQANWPMSRAPYVFETSLPGVFAVGDVRSNSVKRVASAVGEGSICIQMVHKTLNE